MAPLRPRKLKKKAFDFKERGARQPLIPFNDSLVEKFAMFYE